MFLKCDARTDAVDSLLAAFVAGI